MCAGLVDLMSVVGAMVHAVMDAVVCGSQVSQTYGSKAAQHEEGVHGGGCVDGGGAGEYLGNKC